MIQYDEMNFITEKTYNLLGRGKFKEGDLLFCLRGSLGKFAKVKSGQSGAIASSLIIVKPTEFVIQDYIAYYFRSSICEKMINKFAGGAAQPNLGGKDLAKFDIPIPPLEEQKRIVAILDEAFVAIDKAKTNTEQNLKNTKEIFESYLQNIFQTKGKDWEYSTLNQISENLDSKRIPITKNKRQKGNIPYYGASGIVDYVADYLFDEELLCISEDGANLLARTYPIAFSINGKTWVNNHAHVLRFKNLITQKFVEEYINSIKIDDFVSGMAQPKLNQAMLNKIPIPLPSIKEQQAIVQKLDSLRSETQQLEAKYTQKLLDLEELKKAILQKAFTGELIN